MVKTQASFFAPGTSDTIEYAIFLECQCQETAEFNSRGRLFQPVWIYEDAESSTLNFRPVGVFGSPQDKFAFQSCCALLRLKMLLEYLAVF